MLKENAPRRVVKVLRDSVARRIAAGEVIDRPASVVRELVDNAIDAGSSEIAVYIEEGGAERIRVVDNGCGMTKEDLGLCCLPHATSKIETEDDLYRITSLGFRGEALASIVTVARCEITSRTKDADAAYKIVIHGGGQLSFESCQGNAGTVVDAADLFYAIPARRRFMKTVSAETAQCKTVFLEKAAAFPEIAFRFFTGGSLKVFLPVGDVLSRISAAYGEMDRRMLFLQTGEGDGFRLSLVAASPDFSRRDRKYIQVYVNRRRVWEYSLLQGVEYAYSHYLPGGVFPCCFVFAEIDPDRVDFNIHPAKKEAKIKNVAEIRHRMGELLESFLRQFGIRNRAADFLSTAALIPDAAGGGQSAGLSFPGNPAPGYQFRAADKASVDVWETPHVFRGGGRYGIPVSSPGLQDLALAEAAPSFSMEKKYDFIYRGQVFGLFLIAEKEGTLYLVDQHAAHERIIYETLAADMLPQPLLIPHEFETGDEEDAAAACNEKEIAELGIKIRRLKPGVWALTALPESYRGSEDDIIRCVTSLYAAAGTKKKDIIANLACKKAIQHGSPIDPLAACEIIKTAFTLENPRCPHGRPLWFAISREELFRKVGRIV
jgi:DNA mismatch repair protein MutL